MTKQEIISFLGTEDNWSLAREVASEILATHGFVPFLWGVDDIRSCRGGENLTDEQCMEILNRVESGHDASIGVNWDVLSYYVSDYVGEDEDEDEVF